MADRNGDLRRRALLAAIRARPRDWTTGDAHRFYRAEGWAPLRTTARLDLKRLVQQRQLLKTGPDNARVFRLKRDGAPGPGRSR